MSRKKQTKQISKSTFYVVTMKYRTASDSSDSFGNIIPANTKIEISHLAVGVKGIEAVMNAYICIDNYIFDEVAFKSLTEFKGNDGDILLNYKLN